MILDGLLTFTGTSNGATGGITSGAQTDFPAIAGTTAASNIIDLGVTGGIPASAVNGGGARDIGTGDDPSLKLSAIVTAAYNNITSLGLLLQGAPDAGSNTPGAWTTMWASPSVVLLANLVAGAQIANIDVPRPVPGQPLPRYLRLEFVVVGTTATTGGVEAQIVIDRDDQVVGITGAYSGYQAGINVAN
jgi:hypothetical protein